MLSEKKFKEFIEEYVKGREIKKALEIINNCPWYMKDTPFIEELKAKTIESIDQDDSDCIAARTNLKNSLIGTPLQ